MAVLALVVIGAAVCVHRGRLGGHVLIVLRLGRSPMARRAGAGSCGGDCGD
jgi:hypothetical protein